MPNVHPLFVHIPIPLLSLGILFEMVALFRKRDDLSRFGWWLQLLGTLGLAGAVVSGLMAEGTVTFSKGGREIFTFHEQIALVVATLFGLLLFWRLGTRGRVPPQYKRIYVLVYLLGVLALWVGAWYGGEMVYTFGTGVHFPPH